VLSIIYYFFSSSSVQWKLTGVSEVVPLHDDRTQVFFLIFLSNFKSILKLTHKIVHIYRDLGKISVYIYFVLCSNQSKQIYSDIYHFSVVQTSKFFLLAFLEMYSTVQCHYRAQYPAWLVILLCSPIYEMDVAKD
jgi:hypothetical protein